MLIVIRASESLDTFAQHAMSATIATSQSPALKKYQKPDNSDSDAQCNHVKKANIKAGKRLSGVV